METDTSVTPAAYRWKTEFVYDGLRRLRTRSEYGWVAPGWYPNSTTLYVYDGRRVVQERNSANGPTVSYVRGLDLSGTSEGAGGIGGLLARSSGYQTNGSWTSHAFYHADGGGNVTFLSPSTYSGTMTRYSYDAYGRTTSLNGPLATANVYRFSSKVLHAASGHYYYGYRFYDPQAQRWINRDPLGEAGGMNLYGFVGNGPVGAVDSSGLHGNVISSTLPGMAGTWTSNPYGAGSPGTLPGDFFVPMPPAWTTPSELADVEDQQVARVTESLESESILGNTALYLHANIRYGLHDMLRFGDGMAEGSLTDVTVLPVGN
jgi:RHS repeat-associated protein